MNLRHCWYEEANEDFLQPAVFTRADNRDGGWDVGDANAWSRPAAGAASQKAAEKLAVQVPAEVDDLRVAAAALGLFCAIAWDVNAADSPHWLVKLPFSFLISSLPFLYHHHYHHHDHDHHIIIMPISIIIIIPQGLGPERPEKEVQMWAGVAEKWESDNRKVGNRLGVLR